jgi:hypothetical protein
MELICGILFIWVMVKLAYSIEWEKKCAWCGCLNMRKLKFVSGKEGDWFWEYRNKDGSPDKRVNDNYQKAGYNSIYDCSKCSASTAFTHFVSKKPSKKIKIWKRTLSKKGQGERKGNDWSSDGDLLDTKSANRKNN